MQSSPQAGCSAALRPDGDCAAFRGGEEGVGTKGVPVDFDGLRRVEQRAL